MRWLLGILVSVENHFTVPVSRRESSTRNRPPDLLRGSIGFRVFLCSILL
jgi:hypothetical protein